MTRSERLRKLACFARIDAPNAEPLGKITPRIGKQVWLSVASVVQAGSRS